MGIKRLAFLIPAAVMVLLASHAPVWANPGCAQIQGSANTNPCEQCTNQSVCTGNLCYWWTNPGHCESTVQTSGAMPSLVYPTNPAFYTVGTAITPNVPTYSPGAYSSGSATSYSMNQSLPPGLSLNAASGVISGTPSAARAASSYGVSAYKGSAMMAIAGVNITVALPSPPLVHYKYNPAVYTKGFAIAPNNPNPSGRGDGASSWSVSPALPAGLSFNAATGFITGTPAAVRPAANYTVTGSNAGGSTTQAVSIQVKTAIIDRGAAVVPKSL